MGLEDKTANMEEWYERPKPSTINANLIDYSLETIFDDEDYQHYNIPMVE